MPAYMEGGEAFDEETSAEGPHGHGLLIRDLHAFGEADHHAAGHGRLHL